MEEVVLRPLTRSNGHPPGKKDSNTQFCEHTQAAALLFCCVGSKAHAHGTIVIPAARRFSWCAAMSPSAESA